MEIIKCGSLCFWGDWFGRPYDNCHTVKRAKWDVKGSFLVLTFDESEQCTICHPGKIVNTTQEFCVETADKITWEWYDYGRGHTGENLCRREYTYKDGNDKFEDTVLLEYSDLLGRGKREFCPGRHFAFEIC